MMVQQTLSFKSKAKKLNKNQLIDMEKAIKIICENPLIGIKKTGDLAEVSVYKFKMNKMLHLLAYTWDEEEDLLTLLKFGVHENFYRDLK